MTEAVNIDAMNEYELKALCEKHPNTTVVGQYARTKLQAMAKRLAGQIEDALRLETHMDRLYDLLPTSERW